MSEKDYREAIAAILVEIERKSRKVSRHVGRHAKKMILPATLGAGLALGLGGCSDDTSTKPDTIIPMADAAYGAPPFDIPNPADVKADTIVAGPDAAYGVPFDLPPKTDVKPDASASDAHADTK